MNAKRLFSALFACTRSYRELSSCLKKERELLITFQLEALLANNQLKDRLRQRLVVQKAELKKVIEIEFRCKELTDVKKHLPPINREAWDKCVKNWNNAWDEAKEYCESNRDFIAHSLTHLDELSIHLKRLLNPENTYSQKGVKKETSQPGKVIEASF